MIRTIPAEFKQYRHWVIVGDKKIPLNPYTGEAASVTDPATWGDYDAAARSGRPVGFVLTDSDPYFFIDLDNKPEKPASKEEYEVFERILRSFPTYVERSISGHGYHIVGRGRIPRGIRRGNVEVYSSLRYMVMTGDAVNNLPIIDCQPRLDELFAEMARHEIVADYTDQDEEWSDKDICERAMRAENGDKYTLLCNGRWQEVLDSNGRPYPSQSEADQALVNIIAFYSKNNEQVARLFHMTQLGKREKAQRPDYLRRMIAKARAAEIPPVDMSAVQQQVVSTLPATAEPEPVRDVMQPPPGLIGELAQYLYATAYRPIPELALVGAIALCAGIAGRAYTISQSGLNVYMVFLAKTGAGKASLTEGLESVLEHVRPQVPAIDEFIGPANFASGPALIRMLDKKNTFVSIVGEFGHLMGEFADERNKNAQVLMRMLMDLYQRSGPKGVLRETAYSDSDKNTRIIRSPAVTILGESTPEKFYDDLNNNLITCGFLPRFSIIEYTGRKPNPNPNAGCAPPKDLVDRVAALAEISLNIQRNNHRNPVQAEAAAQALLRAYERECDDLTEATDSGIERELHNRAYQKALRLAALIAVGVDPHTPIVTPEHATWAIQFVRNEVQGVLDRFNVGNIGTGGKRRDYDMARVIEDYLTLPFKAVRKVSSSLKKEVHAERVITFDYIRRRCLNIASFYSDRRGVSAAIQETLRDLIAAEVLVQLPAQQMSQKFNMRVPGYSVGVHWDSLNARRKAARGID